MAVKVTSLERIPESAISIQVPDERPAVVWFDDAGELRICWLNSQSKLAEQKPGQKASLKPVR